MRSFADVAGNPVGREESFVLTVGSFVVADLGAALVRGPKIFSFAPNVVCHHRRRRLEDVLRGAVVLFQANDFGLRKIFFELEDVANVGSAPRVDRLIFIANGADVVACAREHQHELVLRTVRVLIFVDQDVLKAAVVILAHRRGRLQQTNGVEQQVIEIEGIGLA